MPSIPRPFARLTAVARLLLGALLASLIVAAPAPAAGVGAVTDLSWGISRADMDRTVASLVDARVRTVRVNASWSMIEPNAKGSLDSAVLGDLDYAVDKARAAGIEVLMPISDGVPYWASADPQKSTVDGTRRWNRLWRPTRFSDYADVVGRIVRRYSQRGVHSYEVWNEPNHHQFWPSGVNAAEYVEMLKAAAPAIRAEDPSARVVLGGLSRSDYPYLEAVYAAGAAPYFDVAAVHPYTGSVDPTWCWNQAGTTRKALDAFCAIEEVRASMVAAGDGATPLWLTEFGWSTTTGSYGVSEAKQAEYLTKAFRILAGYEYVTKAFWYSFRNTYWLRDDPAQWEANAGLLRTDFSRKPAFAAMAEYAATQPAEPAPAPSEPAPTKPAPSEPAPTEPAPTEPAPPSAGNQAPTVALAKPVAGGTFSSTLALAASASDDRGVVKVEFLLDGRVVASDSTAPYEASYKASKKVRLGDHSVTARAVDGEGLRASSSVTVTRVSTTSTALGVSLVDGPTAHAASIRPRPRRAVAIAHGRVRGASRGRVTLTVTRRDRAGRPWRRVKTLSVHLTRTGRFRARLVLGGGASYRVQARFAGRGTVGGSRSRVVRVRASS